MIQLSRSGDVRSHPCLERESGAPCRAHPRLVVRSRLHALTNEGARFLARQPNAGRLRPFHPILLVSGHSSHIGVGPEPIQPGRGVNIHMVMG